MTFVMGLDVGTSGGRALVCDEKGQIAGYASRPWHYRTDADGFPEIDAAHLIAALASASREALRASMARPDAIAAVGVTSQRTGIVLVDEAGAVLHAGPNTDPRGLQHGIEMEREHGALVYETAGRLPVFLYLPARLAWFRANKPEIAARAAWAMSLGDWVAYTLSGEAATDPTQAAEMLCYSLDKGTWSDALCESLGVDASLLPPLAAGPAGTTRGSHEFGLADGTPVVRAGADTQCAALAAGVRMPGDAVVPAGTTMPVGHVVDAPLIDPERRLWTSPHAAPGRFLLESHCGEAGALVEWMLDHLGARNDYAWLEQAAAAAEPGAGGVGVVDTGPTAMGDYPMLRVGGLVFPIPIMALGRGREDFARATLEGIAYAARGALEWTASVAGSPASTVAVCGGLARSDAFTRILASVLGRPVRRARDAQASAIGAAIGAAAAAGVHASVDEAAGQMAGAGAEVEPDAGSVAMYEGLYPAWCEMRAHHEQTRMRVADLKGRE